MRSFMALVLVAAAAASFAGETYVLAEVYLPDEEAAYRLASSFALDVVRVDRGRGGFRIEIVTDPWQARDIRGAGFDLRVLIDDMEAFYASRYHGETMGGFRTYDEINAKLDSLHNQFPAITTAKFSIGNTWEVRPMYALEISDNPGVDEGEPGAFYDALIHAREPTGSMCLFNAMDTLLYYYSLGEPAMSYLVNHRRIFIEPCSNPDGYEYNRLTNPGGGGMWRKNRHAPHPPAIGIDLNRNFGYLWGYNNIGSSPDSSAETYRGDSAWSEPETRNIRDFLYAHPEITTHWHIHTYSDLWLWPYGPQGMQPGPDTFAIYQDWDTLLCQPWAPWPAGPSWQVLYETNGGAKDWSIHNGIIAISPEIGATGFWPSPSELPTQYANTTWPIINWIRAAGAFPVLTGFTIDDSGGNNNGMIDPGESPLVTPDLRNVGLRPDWGVYAVLRESDAFITLPDSIATFGDVPRRSGEVAAADGWTVSVDGACPIGHAVAAQVVFRSDSGYFGYDTLEFVVGAPPDPTALPIGPDAYGYYAYDYHDVMYTECPTYDWFDVSGFGTPGPSGDDARVQATLPFTFRYYGTNYTTAWICTNGWVTFGSDPGTSAWSNTGIPTAGQPNGVFGWWDDMNTNNGGNIRYYSDAANHRFIVQWTGVAYYSGGGNETYQIILMDPAYDTTATGDGEIYLVYNDSHEQSSSTVGIENPAGSIGIQYFFNGAYDPHGAGLGASTVVKFTTDPPQINAAPDENVAIPTVFALHAVYPNPFNPATTISFDLPSSSHVLLEVYNVLGQRVATLLDERMGAGRHEVRWDASAMASGVYFARIVADQDSAVRKVVLLK